MDEDVRVVVLRHHALRVGHEVRAEVTAVELHAEYLVDVGVRTLGLLDGNDAVLGDALHSIGDELADLAVVVSGDGCDLLDLREVVTDRLRLALEVLDDGLRSAVDTPLEVHRVGTRGHGLKSGLDHRLREYGSRSRTVASCVGGLGGNLLNHLRAHVGYGVFEFDLLRYGDTVLRDDGCAEALLDNDVAAFRAEGNLHRVGEGVDAGLELLAGVAVKGDFLRHACSSLRLGEWSSKRGLLVDHDEDVVLLDHEVVLALVVELLSGVLAVEHDVALLDAHLDVLLSGTYSDDFTALGLLLGGVGDDEATGGTLFGVGGLHNYAIVDRLHARVV